MSFKYLGLALLSFLLLGQTGGSSPFCCIDTSLCEGVCTDDSECNKSPGRSRWQCLDSFCQPPPDAGIMMCRIRPDGGLPDGAVGPFEGDRCGTEGFEDLAYESTQCIPGSFVCLDDGTLECQGFRGPEAELCNGADDDCDGVGDTDDPDVLVESPETDALERVGDPCCVVDGVAFDPDLDGVGVCRCAAWACQPPEGGQAPAPVCPGAVGPVAAGADNCDNGDEDCDGVVDEDGPTTEICDRADNDCDGRADEGPNPPGATEEQINDPDREDFPWTAPELCNGADDDCDGTTDEGFTWVAENDPEDPEDDETFALGDPCAQGLGECRVAGVVVCDPNDPSEAICDAEPGEAPEVELCDGLDDDCDGETDEGFPDIGMPCTEGFGACEVTGIWTCNGIERVCSEAPGEPIAESCNGIDDDCDGDIDETCACNPLDDGFIGAVDDLGSLDTNLSLRPERDADTRGLDSACAPDAMPAPRNEQAIIWRPGPGLRRIEVVGRDFDPQIHIADLCRDLIDGGDAVNPVERACVRDSGLAPVETISQEEGERAAAVVVNVPDGAPAEVGIYVESQDGEDQRFSLKITDPTGGADAACEKSLTIGGTTYSGVDRCQKRLWKPLLYTPAEGEGDRFDVLSRDAPPRGPYGVDRETRWDDPRWCLDNDGRASSVEVDWADLSGDGVQGVQGVMLPEGGERGDWWSTRLPASGAGRLFIEAEPVGLESVCAANSMRLIAYLSCVSLAAPEDLGETGCTGVDPRTLRCDQAPDDDRRYGCDDGFIEINGVAPKRTLSLINLVDDGCRDSGDLVLHVGVIRADDAAPGSCTLCEGQTVDPGACFRYRLRVTE